ncbi:MAG TPA: hypothetical protein VFS20_14100, partial [Longimicrobium sp.]|nr:hypothetical protein [Longimicrobium sp.]
VRWSCCPRCDRLMHKRRFPLLIAFGDGSLLTVETACRYCTPCEFIIAHQHELDGEVAGFRSAHPGDASGEWRVIGTVERKAWETALHASTSLDELREHTSDIRYPTTVHDPRPLLVAEKLGREG